MAFPTIPTVAAGRVLSALALNPAGTHTSPSLSSLTKNAGDLLIAIVIIYDGNSTNAEFSAWGGGFTECGDFAGTATMGIGVAYKWSTGSETGTFTVTSADASANDSAFFLLSIPGAHATTPPEAGSFATGTGAADPASFDPAGWAAEDTLWIAVGGSGETSGTGSYTGLASAPTNYGNYADSGISADVVGGVEGAVAFRQLNAASENVGAFTGDTSNARDSALVIAVRPAPAVTDLAPSPVAVSPAVPVPTLGLALAFAPAPVTVTPAVPAPTLALSLAFTPAVVSVTPSVPSPTLATPLALTPDPVALTLTVPASTLVVDQLLTPGPVVATLAAPAPTLVLELALQPAPVAALPSVPIPTLDLSYTLMPGPIQTILAVPSPALDLVLTLTPSPLVALLGVPATAVTLVLELQPSPIAAILVVPEPFLDAGGGDIFLAPTPIAVLLGVPAAVLDSLLTLTPDPVAAVAGVPALQLDLSLELAPAPIAALLELPSPSLALIMTLAPDPVAAITAVPVALLGGVGDVFLEPAPVAVLLTVPRSTVRIWQGRFLTTGGEWISFARHD